ncbi:hypothetical protein DWZ29_11260, partial [Anaerobutyricum hallii]
TNNLLAAYNKRYTNQSGRKNIYLQYFESKQKTSTLSLKSPQPLFNSNKIQPKTARVSVLFPGVCLLMN